MKKILHILSQRPGKTGSGVFLQSLIGQIDKKDYQQAVVAGIPAHEEKNDLKDLQKYTIYPVRFETESLPFPVVGMSDVMPYESTKYIDLTETMLLKWKAAFEKMIQEAVDDFRPDLIISHHLWLLSSFVREWTFPIPMMAICHGTDLRKLKQIDKYASEVINGCKKIGMIFALNSYQKEEIHRIYKIPKENIIIIGNGYNGDIFFPENSKKNNKKIRLVYAGKLSYAKGIKALLKAYENISIDKDQIELTIVGGGSGKEFEDILKEVKKHSYKIILTGIVPQNKLGEIFRKSDIFILPSFYEGLPLVLIEALASGLRVVSSDLPGVKEWMGEIINDSGMIEYVKLPSLKNVDMPVLEELPLFEERLKKTIENQIQLVLKKKEPDNLAYFKEIKKKSWENLFDQMEKCF
ncbi:MAG: glycosyltransferase family 4 protein [Marinisporobacter sp.]|jgi:glycosyltransferase involved in cell wall biosynthesis|nr:glycosyltransferase family 4 protein [Marinisporobacter sp.]